ncbi:MAG TPA: NifU family protein [Gemmatimonadales bacterium]|jgi:Fe-S cluster biogenesis protein NfuA|nr:NifU family protein [Gemmatimonadales bacterium]
MEAEVRITAEPIDNQRCKFVVNVPVLAGGVRRFSDADEAKGSPLAAAIFAIPGLGATELIVSGNIVTVVKQSPTPWQAAGKAVGAAIRSALAADVPAVAPAARPATADPSAVNDDALYEQVAKVFDEQVNPMVARHGGSVELIDVQDAVVMLRMGGGCQGCGMADVTLRQGIEGMLAQLVPAVRGIVDITDHTSGANPYFQAAKK